MLFNKTPGIRNQILISACIYLGQIVLGYTITWTGPIIPKLRDPDQSPLRYVPSEAEISLIASILYIGAIPGPYVMGWLSNSKGRKPCLILGGVLSVMANVILSISENLAMLYCGRIVAGAGTGIISLINVVYIGEIASTSIRGFLLTAIGIFTTVGAILLLSVGPFFSYHTSTYTILAISIIFTACVLLLPESPIFHVLKDDEESLVKVLKILGRLEDKDNLYEVKKEFKSTNTKMDWRELFTLKTNRRALFIVVTINILQHGSGVMAVFFFSASIFEMAGSSISASVSMIIIGGFELFGSIVSSFFIERLGRRTLLIISTIVCAISMFSLGLYFYLDDVGEPGIINVQWLPLVILIVFFIGYDFGLGIVPNVLIGEMFTCNVRSKGSAVALTCAWLAGFLVTTAFGSLIDIVGGHVMFWFFTCTCTCALLFTIFFIPETKAKSLLEIQKHMAGK